LAAKDLIEDKDRSGEQQHTNDCAPKSRDKHQDNLPSLGRSRMGNLRGRGICQLVKL